MAEILGVVTGVVGVAGFAIQIVDTVQKLKYFASKLKHANAQLDDLLDELDLLATVIAQSDYTEEPSSTSGPGATSQTPLHCCEKAAQNIAAVANNIQKGLQGS